LILITVANINNAFIHLLSDASEEDYKSLPADLQDEEVINSL
jgi:hypothetical protein